MSSRASHTLTSTLGISSINHLPLIRSAISLTKRKAPTRAMWVGAFFSKGRKRGARKNQLLDADDLFGLFGCGELLLGHGNLQDAVFEFCGNVVFGNVVANIEAAAAAASEALLAKIGTLFVLVFGLGFGVRAHGKVAVL